MVNLTLNGVQIDFPFKPYDVQEKFMESVLECLQKVSSSVGHMLKNYNLRFFTILRMLF